MTKLKFIAYRKWSIQTKLKKLFIYRQFEFHYKYSPKYPVFVLSMNLFVDLRMENDASQTRVSVYFNVHRRSFGPVPPLVN